MTQGDPPQQSDWREIGRRHEATYWVALIVILTLVILFDKETFSLYRSIHNIAAAGAASAIVTAAVGRIEVRFYKKARQEGRQEEYARWQEWRTNGQNTPPPDPPKPDPPATSPPTQGDGSSGTDPGSGAGSGTGAGS
jgi:hypothetical protein